MRLDFSKFKWNRNLYFNYWFGNTVTILMIIYAEYCHQTGKQAVAPFALLMLSIVFSTSTGGLRLGLVSTVLVTIFTVYSHITSFGPTTLTGPLLNTLIAIGIYFTQAIVLGVIKTKKDQTIVQLEVTQNQLHNELEDREIKLKEALEKALIIERGNTLGKFATGISHDFNNILQSIMSLSELSIIDMENPDQVVEFQKNIIRQSELGSKLIQQIMDFSRKSRITEEKIDLNSFLIDFTLNSRRIVPKQIDISYNTHEMPVFILFDPTHLNQILLNIISNAKDAIDSHGKITISLENPNEKDIVSISVSDTGCGIPDNILPHIFEPYFTTKNRSEGTGLGLAQVWGLVQQHGGSIEVRSQVNQGTTFIITIPKSHLSDSNSIESTSTEVYQSKILDNNQV